MKSFYLPDQDESSTLFPSETGDRNGWEGRGEEACGIFPLQSQEVHISVAMLSYRQILSEDGNKFLRFPPLRDSYFPCREMGLEYFPLEVCGFLKWLLNLKMDIRQSEKEAIYIVLFNMTNNADSS